MPDLVAAGGAGAALGGALAVLSAMVLPVVMISACGQLVISTSNRLSRTIERTRAMSARFSELMRQTGEDAGLVEEREVVYRQLARATRRATLLQRAMASIYLAISAFVATSLASGATAFGAPLAPVALAFGATGALLLLVASMRLIAESRLALDTIEAEMEYVRKVGDRLAPEAWRVPLPSSPSLYRRVRDRVKW
jgi:hypothetical protein